MKGSDNIIKILNQLLCGELSSINQYFLHSKMCKNWGYNKLAAHIHAESIDEMKHAAAITERILYLEGVPNFQKLEKIDIGTTVKEQLKSDLNFEQTAITRLQSAIEACYDEKDHGTRELLEKILTDEENHFDWIETQLDLIKSIGYERYLSQQL
jgi:bacterioferritin